MAASPEDSRRNASERLHSIERKLATLDERAKEEERRRASRGAELARAAQPQNGGGMRRTQGGGSGSGRPGGNGARAADGGGSGGSSGGGKTNPLGNLTKLFSPKGIEESMSAIGNLRDFCKQAAKYVQQADGLLDSLFTTGSSLKESGILQKLAESKGKMSTADLTNILLALMNSPIGNTFFKRLGGGSGTDGEGESAAAVPTLSETAPAKRLTAKRPLAKRSPAKRRAPLRKDGSRGRATQSGARPLATGKTAQDGAAARKAAPGRLSRTAGHA